MRRGTPQQQHRQPLPPPPFIGTKNKNGNNNKQRTTRNGYSNGGTTTIPTPLPPPPSSLPGRPRRRHPIPTTTSIPHHPHPYHHHQHETQFSKSKRKPLFHRTKLLLTSSTNLSIPLAVISWYILGVISITSSKVLLSGSNYGIPPLMLSVQQFIIGVFMLTNLIRLDVFGIGRGVLDWPKVGSGGGENGDGENDGRMELCYTGLFFGLGFVLTNFSFSGSSAPFVETVKAAEPITSAIVAVSWGVDTVGFYEGCSLVTIVLGVLLSTAGNTASHGTRLVGSTNVPLSSSLKSCIVVMAANMCFSFRGLHQKLFRSTSRGTLSAVDDLNLQLWMQQIGVALFILPALILEFPAILGSLWENFHEISMGEVLQYCLLSLVNGLAFASYNLASTFILTRISVVHHAALNCIRRVFAIVVTAFAFGIRLSFIGIFGIMVSIAGFMAFTHYKVKRQSQPRPLSSLLPMSEV